MYTVVVADDEEELRKALIRKVDWESVGFRVVGEAENGVEALELVEKLEPDLLLTDIHMPFVSGIELARQVREIRPTMHIAFLSGYDDFSYARQAIQYNIISYLLKPISAAELTKELGRIRKKIDDKFTEFSGDSLGAVGQGQKEFFLPLLMDGFQGEATEDRERMIRRKLLEYELIQDSDVEMGFTVLVTCIRNDSGENVTEIRHANAIHIILKKYVRHVSFYVSGKVVSLLTATRAGFDKYLHIVVADIVQSVKRVMNCNCALGVSRMQHSPCNIHEAYVEAMNAIAYSERTDSPVYFISDTERSRRLDQELIQTSIGEIETLIRAGSEGRLKDYLGQFFVRMEGDGVRVSEVDFILAQLLSACLRIAYAVAGSDGVTKLQEVAPPQGQFTLEGFHEIGEKYTNFCLNTMNLISEQRKKSSTLLTDKAMDLIDKQYQNPGLSLNSISREIAVSPNYLSAIIKKSTGSTFVDLLTKKRMEEAQELLKCTSLKIREISERCGYNDQHYFSYCFKKFTGVSPNSCRKQTEGGEG